MKAALDLPLPLVESLRGGFWPTSRFTPFEFISFTKMGHCARNLLEMYLMLVVGEIVRPSLFELLEMYMLDTSLQSSLQVKAQTIPSRLQEHSQIKILMSVISIVFGCNTRHQPLVIM